MKEISHRSITSVRQGENEIKFYDDGWTNLYVAGHEFGPTMIIAADSFESAHDIFIDESNPIEESDVPEAYGMWDRMTHWLCEKNGIERVGHNPEWHHVCDFARKWLSDYFRIVTSVDGAWNHIELDEAYQYQSNATGTGIVNVGHYMWINDITETVLKERFNIVIEWEDDE